MIIIFKNIKKLKIFKIVRYVGHEVVLKLVFHNNIVLITQFD